MNCLACKAELRPVDDGFETDYQFENALWIGFFGGYAMFVDSIDTEFGYAKPTIAGAAHDAVICHDCAHDLCAKVPWIGELLKPETSHSHRQDFWDANPDHVGWDSPKNKR